MLRHLMHVVSIALAGVMTAGLLAQCPRPTPPPAGFAVAHTLAVPVTYSDGYATFGSLLLPTVAPPSCGWPLVVYVHPLGGSRFDESDLQLAIAEQGYAVWSFDVRGQGQALASNPGHPNQASTLWGPAERHDLAEQVAHVANEAQWQNIIDTSRLGVIGTSQGGGHAWLAAAYSGEALSLSGRAPIQFPAVACAIPRDLIASPGEDWLRHGLLFSAWWIEAMTGSYAALPLDSAMTQNARAAFLAQDPSILLGSWQSEGRDLAARLTASSVPVLYRHAYLDNVSSPLAGLARLESMAGWMRSNLSTLGHGVPVNQLEGNSDTNLTMRWLHRFLWDAPNEVELEPRHGLAMMPLDAAERDDPSFAWNRTSVASLVTPATATRYFLHEDLLLRTSPPAPTTVMPRVDQVVEPSATTFHPIDYFDTPAARDLANVLAACPLDEEVWSVVANEDGELVRSASLHLELVPDSATWMLAALLTVEPVGGPEVLLASEALASRTSIPGVSEQHDLRLPPVSVAVPQGATVRLRLRNLWLREYPMQQRLAVAPIFTSFGLDIVVGDAVAGGSWLDLPWEPARPHMVVDRYSIDLATAPAVTATIRAGAAHALHPYFATVGVSGKVPETIYLGETIPIDGDWLVVASAASSDVYYTGFLGFLDADGEATCGFDYSSAAPLPQLLNGFGLTIGAFIWDGDFAPTGEATNSCDVMLR